jgi:hypothetical protein
VLPDIGLRLQQVREIRGVRLLDGGGLLRPALGQPADFAEL